MTEHTPVPPLVVGFVIVGLLLLAIILWVFDVGVAPQLPYPPATTTTTLNLRDVSTTAAPSSSPGWEFVQPPLTHRLAKSADLLYANDFEVDLPESAPYPAYLGAFGTDTSSVTVEAAFYPQYKARQMFYPNGSKGVRFPTITESRGGYNYSVQHSYVVFRGSYPCRERLELRWKIVLPLNYDHSKPSYYYEHRTLFRYYVEGSGGYEIFRMGFVSNQALGFFFDGQEAGPRIEVSQALKGGESYELMLNIEFKPQGHIQASFGDSPAVALSWGISSSLETFFL